MANINPLELGGQLPMHPIEQIPPFDSVSLWLQGCGLGEYVPTFRTAGYDDINLIKILNDEDLDAMGIDKPGTRKKILMYAQQLNNNIAEVPHSVQTTPVADRRVHSNPVAKPKGNSRANPYRCTKCCEYKIRSLDGKAHQCKPELIGHSWDMCPTQNIRQHPEERQRRKQNNKQNKTSKTRKRKGVSKKKENSTEYESPIESPQNYTPEAITPWEYANAHYQNQDIHYVNDYNDAQLFTFSDAGPTLKRQKIDISQQVADVSAAVMEDFISGEISKQFSSGELDPRSLALLNSQDLNYQ